MSTPIGRLGERAWHNINWVSDFMFENSRANTGKDTSATEMRVIEVSESVCEEETKLERPAAVIPGRFSSRSDFKAGIDANVASLKE